MSWVATAIIGGAVIGGVTSASASRRAASAQEEGTQASIAESRRQFDLNRQDLAPFRATETAALGRLDQLQGGDFSGFFTSPGFEFRREEGTRGIENRFAAQGGAQSGNALRRLAEFNQNLASSEFGDFFNRNLALAGLGGTGAGVQAGTNVSRDIANTLERQGDIRASGVLGVNDAVQGTLGNLLFAQGAGVFDPRNPSPRTTPRKGPPF